MRALEKAILLVAVSVPLLVALVGWPLLVRWMAGPPTSAPRPQTVGPTEIVVSTFYELVSNHQFGPAAELWSPRMRASFPPAENIDQRFSRTESIRLQRADVLSQDQVEATVAVDLLERGAGAGPRHYVGTWRLVRGADGWMLDEPSLKAVP